MIDLGEIIVLSGVVLGTAFIVSGFTGAWLHGRAKGRREGIEEAQQLLGSTSLAPGKQDERLDSLLLEVTRLREKQSQISRMLNANFQKSPTPDQPS